MPFISLNGQTHTAHRLCHLHTHSTKLPFLNLTVHSIDPSEKMVAPDGGVDEGGSGGENLVGKAGGIGGGGSSPEFRTAITKPIVLESRNTEEETSAVHDATSGSCAGGSGGSGGPSSSSSSMNTTEIEKAAAAAVEEEEVEQEEEEEEKEKVIKPEAMIKIEEEELEEDIGGIDAFGCGGGFITNNGSSSSSSSVLLPKPMEGLHEAGPPPFLKKTFEMVEDPETDGIVSWSKNLDSFVVWDSHEFSKNLLPKYFKHSNFSSFIRQLNTYGFRKIDPDRWEFANEGFRGGKKHLLKNIRRRSRYSKQRNIASTCITDSTKPGLEAEFENLKNDQDLLRVEILKLRQQQEDSLNRMSAVEERIQAVECKQVQMFIFFTKAARNPGFIQQLIHKRQQRGKLDAGEFCKKRRLLQTQMLDCLPDAVDTSQCINCRNQAQEQLATMQSELTDIFPEDVETCQMSKLFPAPMSDEFCTPVIENHNANVMCGTGTQDMSSVYSLMSEKLFDDGLVVENLVNEEVDVNDSKLYLELEDLIGKPRMWGGYLSELIKPAAGCV